MTARPDLRKTLREILAAGEFRGKTIEAVQGALARRGYEATQGEVWWHLEAIREERGRKGEAARREGPARHRGASKTPPRKGRRRRRRRTANSKQALAPSAPPEPAPPPEAPPEAIRDKGPPPETAPEHAPPPEAAPEHAPPTEPPRPSRPPRGVPIEVWSVAQAIRHLRGARKQQEVAEAGGLDATSWSLYEAARRRPRAENLDRVLQGLGCTRLELEEVAWEFRRERLLEERDEARRSGDPRFVGEAGRFADALRELQDEEEDDPLRRQVRGLLSSLVVLLEEVIVRVMAERQRFAGIPSDEGVAEPEDPEDATGEGAAEEPLEAVSVRREGAA